MYMHCLLPRKTSRRIFVTLVFFSLGVFAISSTAHAEQAVTKDEMDFSHVQHAVIAACPFPIGTLVKLPDDGNVHTDYDHSVYYYGKDCMRHLFPNEKIYFSWYPNFDAVTIIPFSLLETMPLGQNITYRPGMKILKFVSMPYTYTVAHGATLRWIQTEEIAKQLYGTHWNKNVDSISDTFFADYSLGSDIAAPHQYDLDTELQRARIINDNL